MNKETNKINWKKALKLIKSGKSVQSDDIFFSDNKIPWLAVQELNEAGLRVPKNLIDYDDKNIDYSNQLPLNELLQEGSFHEINIW